MIAVKNEKIKKYKLSGKSVWPAAFASIEKTDPPNISFRDCMGIMWLSRIFLSTPKNISVLSFQFLLLTAQQCKYSCKYCKIVVVLYTSLLWLEKGILCILEIITKRTLNVRGAYATGRLSFDLLNNWKLTQLTLV